MGSPRITTAVLLALVATLAFLAGSLVARDVDHCYHDETDKYLFFSSKTPYEFVRAPNRGEEILPHCTPLQVWWLNRHGTRYPGKSTIKSMESLPDIRDTVISHHREGTGRLCDADLDALRGWRLGVDQTLANVLTPAGEQELLLTARRLRDRFPSALRQPYSASRYKFQHTDTQRTEESARRFAAGLFDNADAVNIPPAEKVDLLLQPYTECKVWLEGDKSDPPEWNKLVEGSLMQSLIANVSSRLGYRVSLKFDNIETIYDMCRFQEAWDVASTSPWCAAFTTEELKLLEYAEDLRYYYKSGYGDEKNVKLGCPLAKDLYQRFNALAEGNQQQPSGVFYFAHSSTLHMLQSRLGAYRDTLTLSALNYKYQKHRAWRISLMGSFAANLGAVFYKCAPPGEAENMQVLFLAGEGPLDLPGCKVGLCTWEHVKDLLEPLAQQCDLEWCDDSGATALGLPPAAALLLALAVALANFPLRRAG